MKLKQVLVDMDGVLADVYLQSIRLEQEETGLLLNIKDMEGKKEDSVFPNFRKHVHSKGFFRTAPLMPDSVEGLRYLNKKYNVLIVSSATEFPNSLQEKLEWLNEFFPFITWKQMIFCGKKNSIKGDIMIDDHTKNLDHFDGEKILFTQPHNALLTNKEYKRVNSWKEIMEIL